VGGRGGEIWVGSRWGARVFYSLRKKGTGPVLRKGKGGSSNEDRVQAWEKGSGSKTDKRRISGGGNSSVQWGVSIRTLGGPSDNGLFIEKAIVEEEGWRESRRKNLWKEEHKRLTQMGRKTLAFENGGGPKHKTTREKKKINVMGNGMILLHAN